jgi:hypothetical protein
MTTLTVVRGAARLLITAGILLLLCSVLSAETITGTVNNGTTGKPASRDDVVLIRLGQGMEEAARTRTDTSGHFRFHPPDAGPYLIRAIHQGVTYHRMAPPGSNSVELQVFDVSKNVAGVSVTADVMRFQARDNELQGIRLFAVNNASNPPRTQMHGKDFEFFLPDGAQIDQGMAMTAGGQPVNSPPVPEKAKNCYGFVFPLRPGETQFQIVFHMKYSGELSIDPKALYGAGHFVVMVPKTMQFTAAPGIAFQAMEDPRQSDALVRVMANTRAGQPLNFSISGTGMLNDPGDDSQGAPHPVGEAVTPPARDSHQGEETKAAVGGPDRVNRYRWYILSGVVLLLGASIFYFRRQPRATTSVRSGASGAPAPGRPLAASASHPDLLLEQLKDKLFQLEVDRQQGRISQPEYQRARAALDRALDRAIKRGKRTRPRKDVPSPR